MASREQIEQRAAEFIAEVATSSGLELVQVTYLRESCGWVLRVLVERVGGSITVEDCSVLSRELSDVLDVEDPIPGNYALEVSSPGLDRPLVRPEDFTRFVGQEITLKTRTPIDGRRNFKGMLGGLAGDVVLIEVDKSQFRVPVTLIEKANLVPVL